MAEKEMQWDNNEEEIYQRKKKELADQQIANEEVRKTLDALKTGVRKQRRTTPRQKPRTRRKKPVIDTSDSDECNYPELIKPSSRGEKRKSQARGKRKKKKKSKRGRGQIKTVSGILTRGVSATNQKENYFRDESARIVTKAADIQDATDPLETRNQRQQAERRKNRTLVPRSKIATGEAVSLQAVVDPDYMAEREARGKPVPVVPPELQSHSDAPPLKDAVGVSPEDEAVLRASTTRLFPPKPSSNPVFDVKSIAARWDQHKKMGTEGVLSLVSPMRELTYQFANAPGKLPKQIVESLAETVNDAVDADLRHIHEQEVEKDEPLPDDTLIRRAKRDEELDQIDTYYHTTLGGPTIRTLVSTTERARLESLKGEPVTYGPKERVMRKLLEFSKDLESGFMWRAKTGRDPRTLAASDLGEPVTLEWATQYMRERAPDSDERECIRGPKFCVCKLIPKLRKACDTVDTVQDEEGFVGIEFYRREEWSQIRATNRLPSIRRPCLLCLIYMQTQKVGEVEARGMMFDTQIQYFRVVTEESGKGWSKSRCLPQVLDDGSPTGIVADTPEFHVQDYISSERTVYINGGREERVVKCFLYRVHSF
jgi:hypothetical protein